MSRDSKPVSGVCKRVSAVHTSPVVCVGEDAPISRSFVLYLLQQKQYRFLYSLIESHWNRSPDDLELARSLFVLEQHFKRAADVAAAV
ncbi:MAG: hypothetical protein AAGE52_25990 [Myxococcota bacterium]